MSSETLHLRSSAAVQWARDFGRRAMASAEPISKTRPNPRITGFVFLLIAFALLTPASGEINGIAFRRHVINQQSEYSAAAVIDVNRDGKLDIVCGGLWYEAPTWDQHFVREVEHIRGRFDGYSHLPLDVNQDDWTDVVTVNLRSRSIKWIQNPGSGSGAWKTHTAGHFDNMETGRLVDVDRDGQIDVLPNGTQSAVWWSVERGNHPRWSQHDLPNEVAGHGIGFGDIDGDGRGDIVGPEGWLKAPLNARTDRWRWNPEFELGAASIPILVVDPDHDGDNDIVWSIAHGFGLYWLEQVQVDGKRQWIHHTIDTSWSQCHAPLWVDLNGNGRMELVAGKRYMAHEGRDAGAYDPLVAYRYEFSSATRTWHRNLISYDEQVGFGLDPKAEDLDGDGDLDLVVSGRSGLYWLENIPANSADNRRVPAYDTDDSLLLVRNHTGLKKPVTSPFDWGRRRAHLVTRMEHQWGPLPPSSERVGLDVQLVEQSATKHYTRQSITFRASSQRRVHADLLIPSRSPAGAKLPAVLCIQATGTRDSTSELAAQRSQVIKMAEDFTTRGYICVVPASPPTMDLAQTVWTNLRAVDLLEAMRSVDRNRMACAGQGPAGQLALLTGALDQRLVATIASETLTSVGTLATPLRIEQLLAAIAPRAVYFHTSIAGHLADKKFSQARSIYQLREVEGLLYTPQGDDTLALQGGREWLDQIFKPTDPGSS